MESVKPYDDFVSNLLSNGAIIIEEKSEGSDNFFGRILILKKDQCEIKIGYLNLCGKKISVQKVCRCDKTNNSWISIPEKCNNI